MTIRILNRTADSAGPTDTLVIFTLVGPDTVDGTYRTANFSIFAESVLGGDDIGPFIDQYIIDNSTLAQEAIDLGEIADVVPENEAKAQDLRDEAKQFLVDNPTARAIIDLDGPALESVIEARTAVQETLLLKTLSFAVRFLFESVRLQGD